MFIFIALTARSRCRAYHCSPRSIKSKSRRICWTIPPLCPTVTMSGTQPLFLGLDLSTQQLKGVVISENSVVVYEAAVHYDKDLPQYETTNGAILGPGDGEVTSPVQMWVDALTLLVSRIKESGVDLSKIQAISGAGQVHLQS